MSVTELILEVYQAGGTTSQAAERILAYCRRQLPNYIRDLIAVLTPEQLIAARQAAKVRIFADAFPEVGRSGKATNLVTPAWDFAVKSKQHVRLGLVTTTQAYWVERYLHASGVTDDQGRALHRAEQFFDVVVYDKEKEEGIKEIICRMLDLLPSSASDPAIDIDGIFEQVSLTARRQFVIFEDSLANIKRAKSLGICVVAVPSDFTRGEAMAIPADLVVHPAELRGLLPHTLIEQLPPY